MRSDRDGPQRGSRRLRWDRTDPLRRASYRLTFAVLITAVIGFALVQSLVAPVLGPIADHIETDHNTATWLLTAYLISAAVSTPIVGRLGDRLGKERMLVASLGALAVGSLIAVFAPTIGWLIAARVVQGAGGGAVPLCFGIIRDEFPEDKIATAVGATASIVAVGGGLGVVLAGPIINALGYAGLFWVPLVAITLTAVAAILIVPPSPVRTPIPVSVAPALLLSSWLVAFLVCLSQGNTWGWTSAPVLGLFGAAAVLCWTWVRVELRSTAPLIDMRMMRTRTVLTCNVVALVLGWTLFSAFAFMPQFAQTDQIHGYGFSASVTLSGTLLLPSAGVMVLSGLCAPALARLTGERVVVFVGCLTMSLAMGLLTLAHDTPAMFYLASGVLGAGQGLVISCMAALVIAAVPPEQTGAASGMNANIRNIGGSIGAAVTSMVIAAHVGDDGVSSEAGYTWAFGLMAATMAVASLVALAIPSQSHRRLVAQLAGDAAPAAWPAGSS